MNVIFYGAAAAAFLALVFLIKTNAGKRSVFKDIADMIDEIMKDSDENDNAE